MKTKGLISLVLFIIVISAMMASCSSKNRTSIPIGNYTVEEVETELTASSSSDKPEAYGLSLLRD